MSLADDIAAAPIADVSSALADPRNLSKWAQVAEDLIAVALPGPEGALASAAIGAYVAWVVASGGGTISLDPDPEVDAQTSQGRGGRNG